MDNELIPPKNWWKTNWKWLLPLAACALFGVGILLMIFQIHAVKKEREHGITFDQAKWQTKHDSDYAYRNKMIKDLVASKKLKTLKRGEIIRMLGQPDRIDSAYLFYRIAQERMGFFPLHTTTLVIKLSTDGAANAVMVHE